MSWKSLKGCLYSGENTHPHKKNLCCGVGGTQDIVYSLRESDKVVDSCCLSVYRYDTSWGKNCVAKFFASSALCTTTQLHSCDIKHSRCNPGWYINMSEWIQQWHQEGFHHLINNVALVFGETESQLFRGQSARTTSIVSSHWKQGEFWHEAEPWMTHGLTDTLYCIPKISLYRNITIVALG